MKPLFRQVQLLLACAFVAMFAACASLGVPPADTFNKKLAATYKTVETVAEGAVQLMHDGRLSKTDAQAVYDATMTVLAALDAAEALAKTDMTQADSRLSTAITILTSMQAFLVSKQQGKPS